MKSYGNSESPHVAFYGCASLLIIMFMFVLVGIMGVHGITQFMRDITLSNNQVAIAEAQRDQAVGVAQAQENGQTERYKIQEDTRVRLDWSFFPNKILNVIIAILVAAFIEFLLSLYFSPPPLEGVQRSTGGKKRKPQYYDELDGEEVGEFRGRSPQSTKDYLEDDDDDWDTSSSYPVNQ